MSSIMPPMAQPPAIPVRPAIPQAPPSPVLDNRLLMPAGISQANLSALSKQLDIHV